MSDIANSRDAYASTNAGGTTGGTGGCVVLASISQFLLNFPWVSVAIEILLSYPTVSNMTDVLDGLNVLEYTNSIGS